MLKISIDLNEPVSAYNRALLGRQAPLQKSNQSCVLSLTYKLKV